MNKNESVKNIKISAPFMSSFSGKTLALEINLNEIVDSYTYHDFPSLEVIYFTEDDLDKLLKILTKRKLEMQELNQE